jgi:hypothetical protein
MVFPITGGNESKGYEISNSLRFNRADTAYLTKSSIGSTTGSGKTFTFSAWVKRSGLGSEQYIIHARSADSQGNFARLEFDSGDAIRFRGYSTTYLDTNRVFRDPSAWYNIVLAVDTDTSGDGNSVRLYVNGVEETSFATDNNPSTDDDLILGSDRAHFLGASYYNNSAAASFDGYMADVYLIDGQQLAPTSFGEFDDNGVWIPKKYTGTFGGNGFKFEFQQTGTSANSSGIGADTSGNDSHFTPTNLAATDITEDTCTNNFATFNPLIRGAYTLSEGNCKITGGSSETIDNSGVATISMDSGKFYCEMKPTDVGGNPLFGIIEIDGWNQGSNSLAFNGYFYKKSGQKIPYAGSGGSNADYGSAISANDIVSLLYDADNGTLSFYLNGSSQGDAFTSIDTSKTWTFITWDNTTTGRSIIEANFGNPAFAVSSGNTDGKYGNFEYAPPSGYYALCTKRLAEFG